MLSANKSFFIPDWDLPSGVRAAISLRTGGVSVAPFASNNLALHVDDDPAAVAINRQQLQQALGIQHIQWLNQVHGVDVIEAQANSSSTTQVPTADAQFSRQSQLACAILTADCLPVLFCAHDGSQVAAAHAGWRGLANGVLLNTLKTFAEPKRVKVFLGPAIGPDVFEVGPEVRAAFAWASDACFKAGVGDRLLADLYQLAREQLMAAGVSDISGGGFCTFTEHERFYSYRRAARTGRLASLIWRI